MTRYRSAVLGSPIAHSLSPVLHTAGYAATGLTRWRYTAIECAEIELPGRLARFGPEWAGLSLTMPLKEAALGVAEVVTPLAAAIGAANTLVRVGSGWCADNTDAPGMVAALREAGLGTVDSMAILGAGGTARAALAAARDLGVPRVDVYARRSEAVDAMRPAAERLGVSIVYRTWDDVTACADADLVVSTVPKGAADTLRPAWRTGTVLFDAIYDPWPTPFAADAVAAGCRIVSGLDLLLHQAIRQFTLFTGIAAPVPAMRVALAAAAATR